MKQNSSGGPENQDNEVSDAKCCVELKETTETGDNSLLFSYFKQPSPYTFSDPL